MPRFQIAVLLLALVSSATAAEWSHSTAKDWEKSYLECAGRRQSPIDIETSKVVDRAPEFLRLSAPVKAPTPQKIVNNGHTVQFDLVGRNISLVTSTTLYMTDALQLHFHTPSEHTIDGKYYPAEVHLVTRTIDHALETGEAGRVAYTVLGLMYEVGTFEDPLLAHVVANKAALTSGTKEVMVDMAIQYDLPTEFYEYQGSLTTPPCFETVHWQLGATPRKATQAQLDALTDIMGMNSRPVQPKNGRVVTKTPYMSFDVSQGYAGCKMN